MSGVGAQPDEKCSQSGHRKLLRMTHCSRQRSKPFALRDALFDHLVGAAEPIAASSNQASLQS
jgi:hypothetical protein